MKSMEARGSNHHQAADEEGAEDENDLNNRVGENQEDSTRSDEAFGDAFGKADPAEQAAEADDERAGVQKVLLSAAAGGHDQAHENCGQRHWDQ